MEDIIGKLKTPEDCAAFEVNAAKAKRDDLVIAARRRGLELKAKQYGAASKVEIESLEAVYAYERVLTQKNGRKTAAGRTWPMIKRHGIIGAVERTVARPDETAGYIALLEMGLEDYAFEAVVLRHPEVFSAQAVERSRKRVAEWQRRDGDSD